MDLTYGILIGAAVLFVLLGCQEAGTTPSPSPTSPQGAGSPVVPQGMVEVEVDGVFSDPSRPLEAVVVLGEKEGSRRLAIWVGPFEAGSILTKLEVSTALGY